MQSLKLALYILCLCLWRSAETSSLVRPPRGLVFANVGANITLECSLKDDSGKQFHWYKQTLGEKPRLISTYSYTSLHVSEEFKNNHRLSVNIIEDRYQCTSTNLSFSDSGIYSCVSSFMYTFQFESFYIVQVMSSHLSVPVEVHQSPSESIQSGGSVTLSCTVQTGSCDEEHTVYWFKNSGESEPGLIYTHRGRKEQCEEKSNMCFYNKNLNISEAGTYYCAVAACGRILFGAGTKLRNNASCSDHLQYALTGALVLTTSLCVVLALSLFKLYKRSSSQCTDIQTAPSHDVAGMVQEDHLHYAALRNQKVKNSRKTRERNENECVYSSVVQ
uniref:Immune-type receptor 11 n=1 Tax=Sphoeroides nephelus TaxID=39110 RepID=Q9IB01_9TELE|nr:immune-type receptor 11 [Sphoeroides nephelus]